MFRSCPGSALHTGLAVGNCATEPEFPESAEKSATRVCRLSFSARPVGWSLLWVAVRRGFPPRTQTAVKSLAGVRRIITTSRDVLSITFDRCLVLKVHLSIPSITCMLGGLHEGRQDHHKHGVHGRVHQCTTRQIPPPQVQRGQHGSQRSRNDQRA